MHRNGSSPRTRSWTLSRASASARERGEEPLSTARPPPPPLPQERATSRSRAISHPVAASQSLNPLASNVALGSGHVRRGLPDGGDESLWNSWPGTSVNPTREVEQTLLSPDLTASGLREGSYSSRSSGEQEPDHQRTGLPVLEERRQKMGSRLPDEDGMHDLRLRLHEIRELAISTEEKAKKMHMLMTQDYMDRHAGSASPISLGDGDAKSFNDEPAALDVGVAALPIDPSNPYNVRPGDLELSYSPLPNLPLQDMDESMEADEAFVLGCMHYKRNVKVQCFDCHRWFPCRYCHDQAQDLPFPHYLRRKMTRNMLCMLCRTPQPAADVCIKCGEYAAWYFCAECKLWDNDSNKRIYHCDDCGICRLGEGLGKDFVHCKKCNVCISIATSTAHTCIENATRGPCPLCLDEMFSSRTKVVSLPCGHYMHAECYRDLMAVTYKCPVCNRSAVNMELQWRKIDDEIRAQPMPDDDDELQGLLPHIEGHEDGEDMTNNADESSESRPRRPRKVWIGCNDCNNRCWTPFHWLGLKCQHCDSYNTNQMPPTTGHVESEAERIIRQQQQEVQQRQEISGNAVLRDAGIGTDAVDAQQARVDSALDVPSSPSFLAVPASPGSPGSQSSSGLPSPRRYFVRDEELRRPSFTAPYFSTPTLPTLPNMNLSNLPEMPRMPRLPNYQEYLSSMPNYHDYLSSMPVMPDFNLPNMPEFPKFSPYQMFDSLSRSLSPMRYYLQGQDVREREGMEESSMLHGERRRERRASHLSVRSDPLPDATVRKVNGAGFCGWADVGDEEDENAVDDNDDNSDDDDDDDDDDFDRVGAPNVGLEDDDEGDSSSESESDAASDAEMADDDMEDGADDMELFGHR